MSAIRVYFDPLETFDGMTYIRAWMPESHRGARSGFWELEAVISETERSAALLKVITFKKWQMRRELRIKRLDVQLRRFK